VPDPQNVAAPDPRAQPSPYPAGSPYGTPTPYATGAPYGGSPYAPPGQNPYPYPPAPGHPYAPLSGEAQSLRTQAIVALVLNGLSIFCCGILGIPGVIVTALALGKVHHDVPGARTLVKWGWGLLIASLALGLAFFAILIANSSST
jgi:hypothetical protein